MIVSISKADPSWKIRLRQRQAVLWLGPQAAKILGDGEQAKLMHEMLRRTWNAVFCDIDAKLDDAVGSMAGKDEELTLRFFVDDAGAGRLPPNRLPVYWLRGRSGTTQPGSMDDPVAALTKLMMLKHAPANLEVFVVGVVGEEDLSGLIEAAKLSDAFRQLVVVAPESVDLKSLDAVSSRLFHWKTDSTCFRAFVDDAANRSEVAAPATLIIRGASDREEIDFSSCIDQSHPITSVFELISSADILEERIPTVEDAQAFLNDPTHSWLPYATGIPFPRHPEYERSLVKYLSRFENEGSSLTCTAWIQSEDGAGATTTLRQLAFNIARQGFPVLVARPGNVTLDFKQLTAFLSQAASRLVDHERIPSEIPWVIAFDAEHTQLLWDSINGLANGLKSLMRSAVVVAVQSVSSTSRVNLVTAAGANRNLGDVLENTVTIEQGVLVGEHLAKFLPTARTRDEIQWRQFIVDTARPGIDSSYSLFWVALHFWFFGISGSDESLRSWLASKLRTTVDGNKNRARALLEIAILGKHRLAMPRMLLELSGSDSLADDSRVIDSPLGLRRVSDHGLTAYSFAHPLVAEEILRIAEGDSELLSSVDMNACVGLLDLELHLLGGLLSRPAAGDLACLPLMEELVTSALRVDPRAAPRNYQVRDRVVEILESASPALWDSSQVFNHHVAKARRHLGMDPPDNRWTPEMLREQLSLAEEHLSDALYNITPPSDSHRESDLNLFVSMALTMDARSRFEESERCDELASEYKKRAAAFYERAQGIDTDNSYVLENFARYKLRLARGLGASEARVSLIVEAIHLLELERQSDSVNRREHQTLEELANAYSMLNDGGAEKYLGGLAARGSEPALVALAKLELRKIVEARELESDCLAEAESLLLRIPTSARSWRSILTLYQVVSKMTPLAFPRRLSLLEELDAISEFAWPQQLRLEYGILLFQAGDERQRKLGAEVYRGLREEMASRSVAPGVPRELKFLRDPRTGFERALKTFIVVKNTSDVGRSSYGVPDGWRSVDIVFRSHLFGRDRIKKGDELDCLIQFTNFGPQAVPTPHEAAHNG